MSESDSAVQGRFHTGVGYESDTGVGTCTIFLDREGLGK